LKKKFIPRRKEMAKIKEVYDITIMSGRDTVTDEGFDLPPYSREEIWKLEEGKIANLSKLVMISHHGTHVDVPYHMIPDGKKLDEYPIERWICPAHVVDIKDKETVRPLELEKLEIERGDAILFKTDNSVSGLVTRGGVEAERWVYVSTEAADFCVGKKVSLIGIDYFSIEKPGDLNFPAHQKILGNDILIVEGINLKEVPEGRYTLFCLPLNLKGADGAPARAVLVR